MLETKEVNLNRVEWIYIPDYKNIEKKEVENIHCIASEYDINDDLEATISFFQSLKENNAFIEDLIEIDIQSKNKDIVHTLLKGLKKRYNFSKIYVYDDLLDIEKIEFHFYFENEIRYLKDMLTNIIKRTVFNSNNIDTASKQVVVSLIQMLKKIEKVSIHAKRKSLFDGNNLKNTIQLIQEMLPNYSKNNANQLENKQNKDDSVVHDAVILNDNTSHSENSDINKKAINKLTQEMQNTQNNMENFKKEMQIIIKDEVITAMKEISAEASIKIDTLENTVAENLNASAATQHKIIRFIESQEKVLEQYKQKLRDKNA